MFNQNTLFRAMTEMELLTYIHARATATAAYANLSASMPPVPSSAVMSNADAAQQELMRRPEQPEVSR